MYFTYLARCADGSLYTGYTDNLKNREAVHNEGRGSRYTRSRLPLKIVYAETYQTKSMAMKREHALKKLKKKEKENLVLSGIPKGNRTS